MAVLFVQVVSRTPKISLYFQFIPYTALPIQNIQTIIAVTTPCAAVKTGFVDAIQREYLNAPCIPAPGSQVPQWLNGRCCYDANEIIKCHEDKKQTCPELLLKD